MMARRATSWQQPSLIVILVAGAITVFFLVAIVREFLQTRDTDRQLGRLRAAVSLEEERQRSLQDLLAYLSSPTFQEQQARLQLGLKQPGERVVIIPESESTNQPGSTTPGSPQDPNRSNPMKWWDYFFSAK